MSKYIIEYVVAYFSLKFKSERLRLWERCEERARKGETAIIVFTGKKLESEALERLSRELARVVEEAVQAD